MPPHAAVWNLDLLRVAPCTLRRHRCESQHGCEPQGSRIHRRHRTSACWHDMQVAPHASPRLHVAISMISPKTLSSCRKQWAVQRRAPGRSRCLQCRAERKEYYDYKDMPPLPLTVQRIHLPQLGYTVVDKATEDTRAASLAIFMDIYRDDQYGKRLTRKSAITALCMYDRDDINEAQRSPGDFPNIDLLQRVYAEGLDLEIAVEELS